MKGRELLQWSDQYRRLYPEKFKGSEYVKTITFVVTERCQLNCKYCYNKNRHNHIMTKEVADQALDYILSIDTGENPAVILDFIGGEPLLEIDLINYIVRQFKLKTMNHPWGKAYMINITTNGLLYKSEKVQRFLRLNRGRVSTSITIDGDQETHDACRIFPDGSGSHTKVEENVKLWIEQYETASTKVTISPNNINRISKAVPYLYDLGVKNIYMNPVFEDVWTEEDAEKYYWELIKLADILVDKEYYKDHTTSIFSLNIGHPLPSTENGNWCGGTGKMLTIGTDGRLYPCLRYMDYSLEHQPGMVIGDTTSGINISKLQPLTSITRRSQSTDECFNCSVAQGCAWCSAYNYDTYGTPNRRAVFICKLHKARVLANQYYWNRLGIDAGCELKEEEIFGN